jgi:predicted  nucleic acid-binding Zn-ribbon protein
MYKEILKYQEADMEIYKIEKKIQNSDNKKTINSMVQKNKEIQELKESLETDAKNQLALMDEMQKLVSNEKKQMEKLEQEFNNKELTEEDFSLKANEFLSKLNGLIKKLVKIQRDVDQVQKKYDDLKKNATIVKSKYKKAKEDQDLLIESEKAKIEELEKKKKSLEKTIDPEILAEYNKYKKENILPVYVGIINGDCCGGCMQKLSTSQLSIAKGKTNCEMCRRIIIR